MNPRSCVVAGATGLVGRQLVQLLLRTPECTSVTVLVRRPVEMAHPKLRVLQTDFDHLETVRESLRADVVFCCLGTTLHQAGSRQAFQRVDQEYPTQLARLACEAGAGQFVIVTAVGADPSSWIFYNRVKGQVEQAVGGLRFPHGVQVLRPSLLLGERAEYRRGERASQILLGGVRGLFGGPLQRFRPIEGQEMALAMWNAAGRSEVNQVYEGADLFALLR
jgi:uncharacterized protein YbjT (DUF2867 family)